MAGVEDAVIAGCDDTSTHLSRARSVLRLMAAHRFGPPERIAELAMELNDALIAVRAAIVRTRTAYTGARQKRSHE